jgi:ribosomal protein S18 acetylase RimI-like enzyme
LTQAVASLGPKQRREYKDASVLDIARELLPPEVTAVCSLSNLCTSPKARRRGIAAKLCSEAERLAKEELRFDEIYLRVESENEAAKKLYEDKLGYRRKFEARKAVALRVDAGRGGFVEIESDIVVMSKKLS